jgi:hypothetical protein
VTSVSVLPTGWASLAEALCTRRPVWVTYHGRSRLLCPHALGWKAGRAMVLGYQTGGETSTGVLDRDPAKRWRLLYVDEIDEIAASDPTSSWGTACNYNASRPFPAIDELYDAVTLEASPGRR